METPTNQTEEKLHDEINTLKNDISYLKKKENSYALGVLKGFLISLLTWYIITPIVHWSVDSMITFFISTPTIEKIKYWIAFPTFFFAPIGMVSILYGLEPKWTPKFTSRLCSYVIVEVVLMIYSFIEAVPIFKKMWF